MMEEGLTLCCRCLGGSGAQTSYVQGRRTQLEGVLISTEIEFLAPRELSGALSVLDGRGAGAGLSAGWAVDVSSSRISKVAIIS
jgi:hypothetical protein